MNMDRNSSKARLLHSLAHVESSVRSSEPLAEYRIRRLRFQADLERRKRNAVVENWAPANGSLGIAIEKMETTRLEHSWSGFPAGNRTRSRSGPQTLRVRVGRGFSHRAACFRDAAVVVLWALGLWNAHNRAL